MLKPEFENLRIFLYYLRFMSYKFNKGLNQKNETYFSREEGYQDFPKVSYLNSIW